MKSLQKIVSLLGLWLAGVAECALAHFATYNYQGGYQAGTNTGMVATPGSHGVMEVILDFAVIAAARSAAGLTALAAADILQVFGVKAGTWVQMVSAEVLTAEGETATIDVGDGADTDGYLNDTDANAVGHTGSLVTTAFSVAVGGGKIYTADDTIDVLLNTAAFNVGKIALHVACIDLRKYRQ